MVAYFENVIAIGLLVIRLNGLPHPRRCDALNGAMRNHRFHCWNSCKSKDSIDTETGLNVDLKNNFELAQVRGEQRLATSNPQRPARCSTNAYHQQPSYCVCVLRLVAQ